ncbi:hypothetical protein [Mariniphaga sp.]|uniref:hypothetical protein n=1 Tax=Mariniphaga sp. TaxID=1954475 RepID=UPI0035651DCD
MKTKMYFLGVFLLALVMGVSAKIKEGQAITGNSLTNFGKYTIEMSESPMVINNQAVTTYELMYEKTANPVRIGVVKGKKSTTFVVRSDQFEVQYAFEKGIFGVQKMEKKYRELPEATCDSKFNKVSYYSQRVITQKPKSEDELLGLIACYFPNLVDEQYHAQF